MKKEKTAREVSDELIANGKKLTLGLTIPLVLFIWGAFVMPFGIILWIIALVIFTKVFNS
jgi:hypothetical protein